MSTKDLPPAGRSELGRAQTKAARLDKLVLQHCQACGQVQYPPRELCCNCLAGDLRWRETENLGTVLTGVEVYRSLEPYFQARSPWLLGAVKLDCGPVALVHLAENCRRSGSRVSIRQIIDASGEAVLRAS